MNNELKNGDIITFRVKRNKVRKIKTYYFQEDCWKLIKAFMFKPAECCDCNLTFPYSELTYLDNGDENICKSGLINKNTPNCNCNSSYDLRCLCYPKKNYRKTNPYTKDFRKCPMRFTSATEFILNDYDKYNLIENATTVKDKIKIFKKIIIKDFKLTSKDFELILKYYLEEDENIIQPILRDQDV